MTWMARHLLRRRIWPLSVSSACRSTRGALAVAWKAACFLSQSFHQKAALTTAEEFWRKLQVKASQGTAVERCMMHDLSLFPSSGPLFRGKCNKGLLCFASSSRIPTYSFKSSTRWSNLPKTEALQNSFLWVARLLESFKLETLQLLHCKQHLVFWKKKYS